MKAPDKIYIRPMPNPSDGYVGIAWDKTIPKCETYIRKDALLEWLDGKLTVEGATEGFVGGYDSAFKEVIDKLNSL